MTPIILTLLSFLISASSQRIYANPEDFIKKHITKTDDKPLNTTFSIRQAEERIITIRILKLLFKGCTDTRKCCQLNHLLLETTTNQTKLCDKDVNTWLSIKTSQVNLTLSTNSLHSEVWLEYTARKTEQCPNHQFQCLNNPEQCFNSKDICDDVFHCKDHSDELGCPPCAPHLTPCNNWSKICFNPKIQRCDGILDCPKGEDEIGCSNICNNNSIYCKTNSECVEMSRICDGKPDCANEHDERSCVRQFCKSPFYFLCTNGLCINSKLVGNSRDDCGNFSDEMSLLQILKVLGMSCIVLVLSAIFSLLIFQWCNSRRDIDRLLQNPPEFPLPPFQGPAEDETRGCYNLRYSESDFRVGGDVYEAFVRSRRRIDGDRNKDFGGQNRTTRTESSTQNSSNEDGEIDVIKALVSLSLPYGICDSLSGHYLEMIHFRGDIEKQLRARVY